MLATQYEEPMLKQRQFMVNSPIHHGQFTYYSSCKSTSLSYLALFLLSKLYKAPSLPNSLAYPNIEPLATIVPCVDGSHVQHF